MLIIVDPDITVSDLSRALGWGFVLRPEMHQGETSYKLSRASMSRDQAEVMAIPMTEIFGPPPLPPLEERRQCVCGMLVWPGEHPHCHEPEKQ